MSKITDSAKDKECQVQIPGICNGNSKTVVWAHANSLQFGKGIGMKTHDLLGAYACQRCHDAYDRRIRTQHDREFVEKCFMEGHMKSLKILIEEGLIK